MTVPREFDQPCRELTGPRLAIAVVGFCHRRAHERCWLTEGLLQISSISLDDGEIFRPFPGILAGCGKTIAHSENSTVPSSRTTEEHPRRMPNRARPLGPARSATIPARPESAKTTSSPRDAPCPRQGRSERRGEEAQTTHFVWTFALTVSLANR